MLHLFTDTDTDITPEVAQECGYGLISMPYSINGETYYPYESYRTFDDHDFYDILRGGKLPTTSAIPVENYVHYFEPALAEGDDILYVHFSKAMSMTMDNAEKAKALLLEKYPNRRIEFTDTKGISALSFIIATDLAKEAKKGKSMDELLGWMDREVYRYAIFFFADDLKFFHRSGRVGGLSAMMGTLVGVRPIITIGEDGKMTSIGTEKGRFNAMKRLLGYIQEQGDQLQNGRFVIAHCDCPEIAQQFHDLLLEQLGPDFKGNIEIIKCNPTIGSHCGPNAMGVAFHAAHR